MRRSLIEVIPGNFIGLLDVIIRIGTDLISANEYYFKDDAAALHIYMQH